MATISGFTDIWENDILAYILKGTAFTYTPPATFYVALSTTTPTEDEGSAPYWNFTEPVDAVTPYARQPITRANWTVSGTAPTQGVNAADVAFPVAGTNWGTVTYFGIFDAATNGNLLFGGQLGTSQNVVIGQQVKFVAGNLKLTLA
jgi:hypothetical protein